MCMHTHRHTCMQLSFAERMCLMAGTLCAKFLKSELFQKSYRPLKQGFYHENTDITFNCRATNSFVILLVPSLCPCSGNSDGIVCC